MFRISLKSPHPAFNSQLVEDFDQQTKEQDCLQNTTADFFSEEGNNNKQHQFHCTIEAFRKAGRSKLDCLHFLSLDNDRSEFQL